MRNLIKKFIPTFLLSWYHFLLAFLGAFFYGFPSKKITVIGVTGTNGKSTVVNLITRILEESSFKVAALSSIKFKVDKKEWPNTLKMTMPGRFNLQKFLKQVVNDGCQYAILEVTSEGIKQYRHKFIDFDIAVFTNLAPEHIEAHGGFENYKQAKGKLFQTTKGTHVINLDDKNSTYFLKFPATKKYTYGINNKADVKSENIQLTSSGINFSVKGNQFYLPLLGSFNVQNALAAIAVGLSQGISLEVSKNALEKAEGIPGRMELVIENPFKVIIDYAVTPESLEKLYQIVKEMFSPQKLIAVFGACGGGRDKWKRPVLGEIAKKYCDEIILTNEDPYNEDPMEIIEQIAASCGDKAKKILDRRQAINTALRLAQKNDTIIITGKGSETWMCIANGKKIPWDEKRIIEEELKKLNQ